jgi:hypothetical protein
MNRTEKVAWAVALLVAADPVLAGGTVGAPAPVAGIGIGAVALIGLGYRALKSRINR